MDVHDVIIAYDSAKAKQPVFAKLPAEDAGDGMCGELHTTMCGAKGATRNWEDEVRGCITGHGFKTGLAIVRMH